MLVFFSGATQLTAQQSDAFALKKIHDQALTEGDCYDWLRHLTKSVGPRLSGSAGADRAVRDMKALMDTLGFDRVYLQPCTVPRWERGAPATASVISGPNGLAPKALSVVSLGNTLGTGPRGVAGTVIEVRGLDELRALDRATVAGSIVFLNTPMDPALRNTFAAYGAAAGSRVFGLVEAAKLGAVAVLVRSLTTRRDDNPHTGAVATEEGVDRIPALGLSTNDSDWLSAQIIQGEVKVELKSYGRDLEPVTSYNVIGEVTGSEYPDEIILVGGHLDSWDLGEGAHDDGTGVVHALQVLPLLEKIGHRPLRTFRCVLFMNEENGLAGGKAYWKASDEAGEFHLAAIESDRGGFTPRGFSAQGREDVFTSHFSRVNEWLPLLEPYGLAFQRGGSGADISGLIGQGGLLLGFLPDSQRYFDFHHTNVDVFEAVNQRELELGAAAITSLVYLIDQHGLR
ncbi:peptidase M28 [Lewinella sp. 4G2]|nr:peptidase M28 [Lewinella sp. 4G2]